MIYKENCHSQTPSIHKSVNFREQVNSNSPKNGVDSMNSKVLWNP